MNKKQQPYQNSLTSKVNLLLGMNEVHSPNSSQQLISIDSIIVSEYQPRQYFDENKLNKLAVSILKHGILEPLIVRKIDNTKLELVAGGRRYLAAKKAKLTEVPVIILNLTNLEAQEIALIENLQREDLNPVEETEGILRLLSIRLEQTRTEVISLLYKMRNEIKGNTNRNVSANSKVSEIETIFEPLSISWKSFVETRLPLLKLPEDILSALRSGTIEYTKALAISRVKDVEERKRLLDLVLSNNLSLSEIKEHIKHLSSTSKEKDQMQQRWIEASKKLKSTKTWSKLDSDRSKQKKLERILSQLEKILEDLN